MVACGLLSGISPCAPLVVLMGYGAAVTPLQAVAMGIAFCLANSVLPLLVLVVFTGALSDAMFREMSAKVRYFQLGCYILFAVLSAGALIQAG